MSGSFDLVEIVRQELAAVAPAREGCLLGVSGGADSVALLRTCLVWSREADVRLVVGHLDHALRPTSAADAAWVSALAGEWGLPVVTERVDVRAHAAARGNGLEEAARDCRYEFLQRAARTSGCTRVVVAHTADDQLETIVNHLLRGTGLAGLRGMSRARPLRPEVTLVRPLLRVRRSDVLAYLESLGQAYLQDASNADITLTRNWIRHRLLPLLRAEFQPQVDDALLRLARQAAEAADVLEESAGELLSRAAIERQRDVVRLSCEPLAEAADIVIREAFRLLWIAQGWPRQRMGFTEWDALCALARRATGDGTRTLPQGVVAERQGGLLRLTYVGTTTAGDDAVSGLPDAGRP